MNLAATGTGLKLPPLPVRNTARNNGETAYEMVLRKLREYGKTVKEERHQRSAQAQCPAHADNSPSLRVSIGNRGDAVLHCYAGCDTENILSALGLTMADLFEESTGYDHGSSETIPQPMRPPVTPQSQPKEAAQSHKKFKRHGHKEGDNTVYKYVSTDGEIVYEAVRIPKPDGGKTFRQRHTDADGNVVYSLKGIEQIPYGLPEIVQNPDEVIHITEGEKDTNNLRKQGVLATSVANGAVTDTSLQYFRDRHVVIHQDNDEPGRKMSIQKAEWLAPVAASIRIMTYLELPEHGDVTDYLASHSVDELLAQVNTLTQYGVADSVEQVWKPLVPMDSPYGPPFPTQFLPDPLRRYVEAASATMQVPTDMTATVALGAISAAVGGRYIFRDRIGWEEPIHGYFLAVASSGSRKSGVISNVTRPIAEWKSRRNEDERLEVAQWESTRKMLKAALSRAETPSKSKSGDTLLANRGDQLTALQELQDHEDNPKYPTVVAIDDATPEAATETLIQQGGALASIAGESKLLENTSAYSKDANYDLLLKGHTGEPLDVRRKSQGGVLSTDRACLTLCMMTQPGYIQAFGGSKMVGQRGLSQRFLITFPRDNVGFRLTGRNIPSMPDGLQEEWSATLTRLLDQSRPYGQRFTTTDPVVLTMPEDTHELLDIFEEWCERSLLTVRGDYRGWCSKQKGAAVRIAGLLHLAYGDGSQMISREELMSGIAISQWYRDHADVMYRMIDGYEGHSKAGDVLDWLRERQQLEVTQRDIWRGLGQGSRWNDSRQLTSTLETLEMNGAVRLQEIRNGGRPSVKVFVNPAIFEEESMQDGWDVETTAIDLVRFLRETLPDDDHEELLVGADVTGDEPTEDDLLEVEEDESFWDD